MKNQLPHNLMIFLTNLMTELSPQMNDNCDECEELMTLIEERIDAERIPHLISLGNGHFRKVYRYNDGETDVVIKLQYRLVTAGVYLDNGNIRELAVWEAVKVRDPRLLQHLAPVLEDYAYFHKHILVQEFVELDTHFVSWSKRDEIEVDLANAFDKIKIEIDDVRPSNAVYAPIPVVIDYGCFIIHAV